MNITGLINLNEFCAGKKKEKRKKKEKKTTTMEHRQPQPLSLESCLFRLYGVCCTDVSPELLRLRKKKGKKGEKKKPHR